MAYQLKNGFFTWENTRWFFAHFICYSILLVGSLTAATGGFKGIPYALANIYPLNLIIYPTYVITLLCGFSVVSGFSNFWSSYQDTLLPYCYNLIDYIHNLILYVQGKSKSLKIAKPATIDDIIENCRKDLIKAEERNHNYKKQLEEKLAELKDHIDRELYEKLSSKISLCEQLIRNEKPKVTTKTKLTFKDYLFIIISNAVKLFSLIIVAIGSLVVIGMGILTNQSFLQYTNIAISSFALSVCVIASIFKQACQLSFSATKQYQVLPRFLWLEPSRSSLKNDEKNTLIEKLNHQNKTVDNYIKELRAELTNIKNTLDEKRDKEFKTSKAISSPILFFRERQDILRKYLSEKNAVFSESKDDLSTSSSEFDPEESTLDSNLNIEIRDSLQQEHDAILALNSLQMRV